MLFYANGEKPLSTSEAKKGVNYHCPECQGVVRLRGGQLRRLHFFHLSHSSCRHSGKSQTHIRLQKKLRLLLGGELERRFETINRIADLFVPSKNLIVEVQCSFLSLEEIQARNRDYASLGLRVLWIFLDRRFARHSFNFPHYFTNGQLFYDRLEKRRLTIDLTQEISLPKNLPPLAKGRTLSFAGDLAHRALLGEICTPRSIWKSLWHILLELIIQ
ncbi:MAG: competence protein CoiA [Chlamydiae bacterium]|nr:competence protein CoiA [Chlamydiota bacterium]